MVPHPTTPISRLVFPSSSISKSATPAEILSTSPRVSCTYSLRGLELLRLYFLTEQHVKTRVKNVNASHRELISQKITR
jgi:hypothetical protein